MKKFGIVFLAICAFLLCSCGGKKSYELSGENPKFTAGIVEEKNPDGKKVFYFFLNDYRLALDGKKSAVAYFNQFKTNYKSAEKDEGEGMGGRIVMLELEKLEMHTVRKVDDIRYASLESDGNYAEPEPFYSSMKTNELLDEYEKVAREMLSVMRELSSRKLNSRQEKRLMQMAEQLGKEFESELD